MRWQRKPPSPLLPGLLFNPPQRPSGVAMRAGPKYLRGISPFVEWLRRMGGLLRARWGGSGRRPPAESLVRLANIPPDPIRFPPPGGRLGAGGASDRRSGFLPLGGGADLFRLGAARPTSWKDGAIWNLSRGPMSRTARSRMGIGAAAYGGAPGAAQGSLWWVGEPSSLISCGATEPSAVIIDPIVGKIDSPRSGAPTTRRQGRPNRSQLSL